MAHDPVNAVVAEYAEQLWPLNAELEALFADWLPRLRAAFGPWRRPAQHDPLGDPDGYGGLDRRGAWERLLVSEWALAREVPDEFVRRAATGEQLFLRLDRVTQAASPHTRVWVDCGPTQLGAPRLAHLAALVVLARRAVEAGGTMSWAPAHDPDAWRASLDPHDVLAARTLRSPELPALAGETWGIGGPALTGPRVVRIREREGGLDVRIGAVNVALDLPPVGVVAQILREPVARPAPVFTPSGRGAPVDALAFAGEGGALLGRVGERVLAWAVPDTYRVKAKLRWADPWSATTPADPVVAAGWHGRKLTVLRAGPDALTLQVHGRTARMHRPAALQVPGADTLRSLAVLSGRWLDTGAARTQVLVRDLADVLWSLDFGADQAVPLGRTRCDPVQIASMVAWLTPAGVWVRYLEGGGTRRPDDALRDHTRSEASLAAEPMSGVVTGSVRAHRSLAVELGGRWWVIPLNWRAFPRMQDGIAIGPADRVCAVWSDPRAPTRCGLLARDAASVRSILAVGGPVDALRLHDARVSAVTVGGRTHPLLAVGTSTGEVVIRPVLSDPGLPPWLSFRVQP